MKWDSKGGDYEAAPTGNHLGQLYGITDLGTQTGEYEGKPTVKRQVLLTWELPEELREDGTPHAISKFYTMSIGEKSNLYKDLLSWTGVAPTAPFDPSALLGKGCTLTIIKNKKDKHVVSAVTGVGKKDTVPETTVNEQFLFSLEPETYSEETFDKISKGIQGIILKSPEYASIISGGSSAAEDENGDIPF